MPAPPARAPGERREAKSEVVAGPLNGVVARLAWPRVGVDLRPSSSERDLEPVRRDRAVPVPAAAKSTQPGPANAGPAREEDHLLERHPQRDEVGEEAGQPGPAGPHHGVRLEHARAEPDPRGLRARLSHLEPAPPSTARWRARRTPSAARSTPASGSWSTGGDPRARGRGAVAARPPASSRSTGTPSARSTRSLSASQPSGSLDQATPLPIRPAPRRAPARARGRAGRGACRARPRRVRSGAGGSPRRTRPARRRGRSGRSA